MTDNEIEDKIHDLNKRLSNLHARFETLWHRAYARLTRRSDADQRGVTSARHWAKSIEQIPIGDLVRFRKLLSSATRGKMVPVLDSREYQLLKLMLKRQKNKGE